MTGGTADPSLEDDDVDNPFRDRRGSRGGGGLEEDLPWNHSLPSAATLQNQQSQQQDAFVLDEDDEVVVV